MDEEIILEGPNMSPKSDVDKEIILERPDISMKNNVSEVITTAPSVVSHFLPSTKVLPETSFKSTYKIQDLPKRSKNEQI